jgi:hypothetical protein
MTPVPARIELTGQRFGRLEVLGFCGLKNGKGYWTCVCDCGVKKEVAGQLLRNKTATSCGCYRAELMRATKRKHGMSRSPEWNSYTSMIQRCYNKRNPKYANYGARGIFVCESWRASFESFLNDMGGRPEGTTLDRIDVNGNYEPSNCRWASAAEQARNRRPTIRVSSGSEVKCLADWADELGVPRPTAYKRSRKGLAFEEVFARREP